MPYKPSQHAQPRQRPGAQPAARAPAAPAGQYRGGQQTNAAPAAPARRGARQALSPADEMRQSMAKTGTMSADGGYPLLNEFRGSYIVEFVSHRYTENHCLKDVVRILESNNDDVPLDGEFLILKVRRGGSIEHTAMKEKEFNTYVVRAYGFNHEDDLNADFPDWPEQILSEEPDYLGRLARVDVYQAINKKTGEPVIAVDKETGEETEVNNERWHASEA